MEVLNSIILTLARPSLGLADLAELYEKTGSATEIIANRDCLRDIIPDISNEFSLSIQDYDALKRRAEEELEFCEKHHIKALTPDNPEYPRRLKECFDFPLVVYYRGTADLNCQHIVNIIGTRKCTTYGKDLINKFVEGLKVLVPDVLIVSGLAYGVDICAHRAALNNGLDTVGVLAHGLDTIYPNMHRETAKTMLMHGGLLTEYHKQSFIDKRNFLQRNRIVAGMSDACIIPESASHGGGLVTCRISTDYGRDVMAFPGPVGAPYSEGCNNLIRDNKAQLIASADDFVNAMGWQSASVITEARANGIERTMFPDLSPDEKAVVDALKAHGDQHPDQLTMITQLSIASVNSALFMLEMNGIVRSLAGGVYHYIPN